MLPETHSPIGPPQKCICLGKPAVFVGGHAPRLARPTRLTSSENARVHADARNALAVWFGVWPGSLLLWRIPVCWYLHRNPQ